MAAGKPGNKTGKNTGKSTQKAVKNALIVDDLPEYAKDPTAELLPFNPLMQSPVITVDAENEQRVELIEQTENLAVLNKQVLEAKRRQVELEVDNKKLDAANKLIDGINIVADKALSPDTIQKILNQPKLTPMDMKFLAEAMDKMANTLKSLMNPSVQDEFGGRKRTKIIAAFQTASGDKMMMSTEVPGND